MPVSYPPQSIAGRQTLWVSAGACLRTKNSGAATLDSVAIAANRPDLIGVQFANGIDQYTQFEIAMPKAWDLGAISAAIHWSVNGNASGDVIWNIRSLAVGDNDSINAAFGAATTISDTFLGDKKEHITAESAPIAISSPHAGDRLIFQVLRKGSTDTLTVPAWLLGLKLFYNTTAATDD